MIYAGKITKVFDPINYEVLVDMGLGITYTCKVKMAGVKYKKYNKDDNNEYEEFLNTKDVIKNELCGKDLMIKFVTDYKDKSGKYLVDFLIGDRLASENFISSGILQSIVT